MASGVRPFCLTSQFVYTLYLFCNFSAAFNQRMTSQDGRRSQKTFHEIKRKEKLTRLLSTNGAIIRPVGADVDPQIIWMLTLIISKLQKPCDFFSAYLQWSVNYSKRRDDLSRVQERWQRGVVLQETCLQRRPWGGDMRSIAANEDQIWEIFPPPPHLLHRHASLLFSIMSCMHRDIYLTIQPPNSNMFVSLQYDRSKRCPEIWRVDQQRASPEWNLSK